ncbi:MAG: hypothetical protein QHH17_00375 [Candidatus Bathyarchaeota archaeon]|nr:hypothetical protein [Candidatus Bathyarchaeota archaeon]
MGRIKLGRRTLAYILVFLLGVALSSVVWAAYQFFFYRNLSMRISYDYIIYTDLKNVIVKNGLTGFVDFIGKNLSDAIYFVLERNGLNIFLKLGQYNVSSNILLRNLSKLKIVSDGAELRFNGGSIILHGEDYEKSMNNLIEGLTLINGSIIVENSFMTTIRECIFKDSDAGIVVLNTNTWTECTLIENCYFENVKRSIVFKTPFINGTKSYANTEIKRCNFKLIREDSIAIHVEGGANFNEGLIQNVRIWLGNLYEANQIGILIEGSMLNTVVHNVVFESFANTPKEIYGIKIGQHGEPPILGQGVAFLGNLTRNIDNPFNRWLYGIGSSFKFENISVSIGLNNLYGNRCEITPPKYLHFSMSTLHIKIQVEGDFSENETVTVRLKLKSIDDSYSRDLTKTFNSNITIWLDHDDLFSIWPTMSIISSLVLDAKTNVASSNVRVYISIYGQYN